MTALIDRSWRLVASWPRRLDALPVSAAVAIETAALAIRAVCSRLEAPDLGYSQTGEVQNPLLRFALCHDDKEDPLSSAQQRELLTAICDAFGATETELSFARLMRSELMNQLLWDRSELNLFKVYRRESEDQPWAPAETLGSTGEFSEIQWTNQFDASVAIGLRFGSHTVPGYEGQYFFAAALPPVIRVQFEPVPSFSRDFDWMRHISFMAESLRNQTDKPEAEVTQAWATYTLVGIIRHRNAAHNLELVRFYSNAGLYNVPPLTDGKYVQRPYVSDDWELGTPGFTYTLLYAPSLPPLSNHDEFVPEEMVKWDEGMAKVFEGIDLWNPRPKRREGALDEDGDSQRAGGESQQTATTTITDPLDLGRVVGFMQN